MNQMDTPDAGARITEAVKLHDEAGFAAMRRAGKLAVSTPPAWTFIHGCHNPASATKLRKGGG